MGNQTIKENPTHQKNKKKKWKKQKKSLAAAFHQVY
jgi:hypothetical protein